MQNKGTLKHQELKILLPYYVKGNLAREERRAVEDHLRKCGDCTTTVGKRLVGVEVIGKSQ